jgi:hypothetical protein
MNIFKEKTTVSHADKNLGKSSIFFAELRTKRSSVDTSPAINAATKPYGGVKLSAAVLRAH